MCVSKWLSGRPGPEMMEPREASLTHPRRMAHTWMANCSCELCRRSCQLCVFKLAVRFKLYCKQCEEDIHACTKDAIANNWHAEFESRCGNVNSFRDMIAEFSQQCSPHGPRKKRQKFDIRRSCSRLTEQPLEATDIVTNATQSS